MSERPHTGPTVAAAATCAAALAALAAPGAAHAPADNSYCLVCHADFKAETLSAHHQKAGVGCAACHGESDRHSSDEDGLVAPDILFARERIKPACMQCHGEAKVRANEEHRPAFETDPARFKTCTGCHGAHRMANRTRVWDKTTGKLLKAQGVRMMQQDNPAARAR